MKSKKIKFSRLYRNNKFILVLSILISLIMWINISLSDSNLSTKTISNIPIQINLSEEATNNGLKIFSSESQRASVSISGNRVSVGNVTADDIVVSSLSTSTIMTPGTYPLYLSARSADTTNNFEIISSVSPSVLTVYVDYYEEETFEIEKNIKYNIDSEYYGELILSTSEIIISGPKTEVDKVESVAIEGEVKSTISEDLQKDYDIVLYDSNGERYSNSNVNLSVDRVTATFNVSSKKEVPLIPKFSNQPKDINVDDIVTCETETVIIAGDEDVLQSIDAVYTDEIDFTTLENDVNILDVNIDIPERCIILNNIESVNISVDLSSYDNKYIKLKTFKTKGLADGYSCNILTRNITIDVHGLSSDLKELSANDISCVIDVSKVTGSTSVLAEVSIIDNNKCWVHGTYEVNVSVNKVE